MTNTNVNKIKCHTSYSITDFDSITDLYKQTYERFQSVDNYIQIDNDKMIACNELCYSLLMYWLWYFCCLQGLYSSISLVNNFRKINLSTNKHSVQ